MTRTRSQQYGATETVVPISEIKCSFFHCQKCITMNKHSYKTLRKVKCRYAKYFQEAAIVLLEQLFLKRRIFATAMQPLPAIGAD